MYFLSMFYYKVLEKPDPLVVYNPCQPHNIADIFHYSGFGSGYIALNALGSGHAILLIILD